MSVASNGLSQHLFNLQTDDEETRDDYQMSSTFGQRENNVKKLAQLLSDSNQLDNELPFIVTNPLPDFVLDEMDVVFILQPHI